MRARLFAVAFAVALVTAYLLRDAGSGASGRASEAPPPRTLATAPPAPMTEPAAPPRNVFEYSEASSRVAARATAPMAHAAPPAPLPSPAARLVGLLRRGGHLQAALVILGETVVLAPGESAVGYTLVSVDEDDGVVLRAPDGGTLRLAPAPE